jgi:hypothetical protein
VGIFAQDIAGLPPWVVHHESSWCPFCYLGWPRDQRALDAGQCCSVFTMQGTVDLHVPAIDFDRENLLSKLMLVFHPKPWEIRGLAVAGMDPRKVRRIVPGLAEAFVRERANCDGCAAWVARRRVPCRRHGKRVDADAVAAA